MKGRQMNKNFCGMDVDEGCDAATTMGGGSDQLEVVAQNLGAMVRDLRENQLWVGGDANKFFESFDDFLPSMDTATGKLQERATRLNKRAHLQIDASK
jgi:uncharacterized protein YukE